MFESLFLAFSLLALATWVCVIMAARHVTRATRPSQRPRRLIGVRAWLFAPLWVPAVLVASALVPGVLAFVRQQADHCATHALNHHHLCLVHPPHAADSAVAWAIVLVVFGATLARLFRPGWESWVESRLVRSLVATSQPSPFGHDVRLLDRPEPIALTVGWRPATILLSQGLVSQLTDNGLGVVLAHERAHIARGDTRLGTFDRLMASIYPRSVASQLLAQISLAREHRCDEAAARAVGGREHVAHAITEFVRLRAGSTCFPPRTGPRPTEARVRRLLEDCEFESGPNWMPIVALAVLIVVGVGPMHSVIEYVISQVVH